MNYFVKKRIYLLCLLFFFCRVAAFSQLPADSSRLLPELTVKDSYHQSEDRSSTPLQLFNRQKLENLNSLQISDIVKLFSGASVKDYGGIGGLKTVSVRGLGANHTAVSYDGIIVTDMQTGQIDIGRYSSENVDAVSLNSGQSDNIFLPARMFASASVLNIQTIVPPFENHRFINGKFSFQAGSFGLVNSSLLLNTRISRKLKFSFNGEWLSANGKYPYWLNYGSKGNDSLKIRQNTDVKNIRLEGTLFANFSSKSNGHLKLYYYQSDRGLPGAVILYNENGFSSQRLKDNNFFSQLHYQYLFSPKWTIQANAKINRSELNYTDSGFLNTQGLLKNNYIQKEAYGSVSTLYKMSDNFSFSASNDFSVNALSADLPDFSYPKRMTDLFSMSGKYVSNQILSTFTLLYTDEKEKVKKGEAAESHQKISPMASISYKPFENPDFRIRAFYKNIFRLPTFNDLYYNRLGNRKLKPEDAQQFNLGITYFEKSIADWFSLFSLSADWYHNEVKNKIVAVPSTDLFNWSMTNYGKVAIDGLDVNIAGDYILSENIKLETAVSFSYQKALDKTSPESKTYNQQLPYIPRFSGSGNASLQTTWFNLSYSILYSGFRYSGYQNTAENRMPGYTDHSVNLSKKIKLNQTQLNIHLQVLNLTNKNYEIIRYFPMQGRSFRVKTTFEF